MQASELLGAAGAMPPGVRLDTTWTVLAALCVYLMHGGFGFFEAGMTRRRNTVTTLTHNLMVLAVTALVYWAVGFALMYGEGGMLMGTHGFFPTLLPDTAAQYPQLLDKPVPLVVAFAFALSYADTPATLVAGAGAERLKLSGFMVLTVVIGAFVFPLVGRAAWAGGVLARMAVPFFDNGSAVIQLAGGLCALVVCALLGPRQGRFNPDGSANRMPSSSLPLVFLGVFILWMGFLAFSAGAMMEVRPAIALVLVNIVLASLAAAPLALVVAAATRGKASLRTALMGMLTASVAVASVSPVVEPWAALVTGLVAGAITPPSIELVTRLGLDDPTEYLTMNVVGGVWGTLAVGLFASPSVGQRFGWKPLPHAGLWYGGSDQMVSQLIGLAAIAGFVVPVMLLATLVVRRLGMLRVGPEEEAKGSDIASSGEEAYEGFAWAAEDQQGEAPKSGHEPDGSEGGRPPASESR